MDPDDLLNIHERLRKLETRVSESERALRDRMPRALSRRSLTILRANPRERLLLPSPPNPAFEDEMYALLKKYSFRLVLRDVIRLRERFEIRDLASYASEATVQRYVEFLVAHGIVKREKTGPYALCSSSLDSFGDTLEWFVAQIFIRKFLCPASWGVTLQGMDTGGDYDVLALVENSLVQVEVKSSPPKHIEEKEINAFLERTAALRPDYAIFLEDTGLRMKDKIVVLFREVLERRHGDPGRRPPEITRLKDEIFVVGDRVFIVNSAPDILQNLAFCLAHILRPTPPL